MNRELAIKLQIAASVADGAVVCKDNATARLMLYYIKSRLSNISEMDMSEPDDMSEEYMVQIFEELMEDKK